MGGGFQEMPFDLSELRVIHVELLRVALIDLLRVTYHRVKGNYQFVSSKTIFFNILDIFSKILYINLDTFQSYPTSHEISCNLDKYFGNNKYFHTFLLLKALIPSNPLNNGRGQNLFYGSP